MYRIYIMKQSNMYICIKLSAMNMNKCIDAA